MSVPPGPSAGHPAEGGSGPTWRLWPLFEQAGAALLTFSITFIASLRMAPASFVAFTMVWLMVQLGVNFSNAVALHPTMWMVTHARRFPAFRVVWTALGLQCALLAGMVLTLRLVGWSPGPFGQQALTLALLLLVNLYEFSRRAQMLRGKWALATALNLALFVGVALTFFLAPRLEFGSALIRVVTIYAVGTAVSIASAWPLFKPGEAGGEPGSPAGALLRYGAPLLGAAAFYWFISGGYLYWVRRSLDARQLGSLPALQNLFSGFMVLLTAFDNWALAIPGRITPRRLAQFEKAFIAIVLVFSVGLAFLAPRLFRQYTIPKAQVALWALAYSAFGSSRLWISAAKQAGDSRLAFKGQGLACVVFLLVASALPHLGVPLGPMVVSAVWVLGAMLMWLFVHAQYRSLQRAREAQ